MAYSLMYAITRFANSVLTGPYKPTPGTAKNYIYNPEYEWYKKPSKEGPVFEDKYSSDFLYAQPPVSITVINKAKLNDDKTEESITLVGINPEGLSEIPSVPEFSAVSVLGRSSPFQMYRGGGARSVKVTLPIYRDLFFLYDQTFMEEQKRRYGYYEKYYDALYNEYNWNDFSVDDLDEADRNNLTLGQVIAQRYRQQYKEWEKNHSDQNIIDRYLKTLRWFKSLSYPRYTDSGVIAPKVGLIIKGGESFVDNAFLEVEGIPNISISYGDIYSHGCPTSAKVDLSITEVVDPSFDQDRIMDRRQDSYVVWNPSKQ